MTTNVGQAAAIIERSQSLNLCPTEIAFSIPNDDRSTWIFIRVEERSGWLAF
jgi:hypothetical protein